MAGAIAVVGGVLRFACVGRSCDEANGTETRVPFCSLPDRARREIVAGFRDGRSPDLMAVSGSQLVTGGTGFEGRSPQPLWPSTEEAAAARVPLVFAGTGIAAGASVPEGASLDDVAATLAELAGLRRPHPEVRSGSAIGGVATGDVPRLIVEVVWKGVGSRELEDPRNEWPFLQQLMAGGAGTLAASAGSAPLDPAAVLTTIGTGGLPYQHGITGTLIRNDAGRLVQAWGPDAPISVIATLPDDIDEEQDQAPMVGLVGTSVADRGVIGGNWYTTRDEDDISIQENASIPEQTAAVLKVLDGGFGDDATTDVLAVVMEGKIDLLDQALSRIAEGAEEASRSSAAIVVTATGSAAPGSASGVDAAEVAAGIEDTVDAGADVIEATTPGGVFLDQATLAEEKISEDVVLSAMRGLRVGAAPRLFVDAFPAIAVSFERYC